MTYEQTLEWMYAKTPMYQRIGISAHTKNLDNIIRFCTYLQNPQKKLTCIHIGGTNGKGSTSHMLSSILQKAGYKVGLYTSPHLIDFRERIKINAEMIDKNYVLEFIEKHKNFIEENHLSFFEVTLGMAFSYFIKETIDIAIIEVGLGGRLDSTNIITPILSIITNISLDHTHMLGNDLVSIAKEKAGIIKPKIPVVIGEKTPETEVVFTQKALEEKSPIYFAETLIPKHNFTSDLKGDYQYYNIRTILQACAILSTSYPISHTTLKEGLNTVIASTDFKGRWQILNQKPLIICDTAHNEAGLKAVIKQLNNLSKEKLHLVLGFVNDKNVSKLLTLFPDDAYYYFSEPNIDRKFPVNELKKISNKKNQYFFSNIFDAYKFAQSNVNQEDILFIGGSNFVVSEIL